MTEDDTFNKLRRTDFYKLSELSQNAGYDCDLLAKWDEATVQFFKSHGWTEYEVKEYDFLYYRPTCDTSTTIECLRKHLEELKNDGR